MRKVLLRLKIFLKYASFFGHVQPNYAHTLYAYIKKMYGKSAVQLKP